MAANLSQRVAERLEIVSRGNGDVPRFTMDGWRDIFAAEDALAAKQIAAEAKALGVDNLRREVAALRQQVATLKATQYRMAQKLVEDVEAHNSNWKHQVNAERELFERVEKLEQRAPVPVPLPNVRALQGPAVCYRGVWSAARAYATGDAVTHRSGFWIAGNGMAAGTEPGAGPTAWQLAAKGGAPSLTKAVREEVARQLREKGPAR